MIIKKYLAKSEKEAIEMAKEDLGSNAIVMNIKKVHPKGLSKLFVRAKVEVTAALDETPAYPEQELEKASQPETPQVPKEEKTEESDRIEDKLSQLQQMIEKQMQEKKEEPVIKKQEKAEDEVKTKATKAEPVKKEETEDEKTVACKELIHKQLIQNEVEPSIADSIMDELNRALPWNAAVDQILASAYQKIILMMGQPYTIDKKKNEETKFVFFLGSTGVGKTTTIAKIASKLKLDDDMNIALVTADTYRIAAVEQLKTYANILSVPLNVVYSPKELGSQLEELKKYDICLVDTAGRSHKNKDQIEDIRSLIEQVPVSKRQVYLVLNAATKYSDLQEIASVYSELSDYSIIFTKLDETSSAGAMFNMRVHTKCPLSYVTWGQNVPDDIGEVDAQKVAKRLLGGTSKD